jgi:hypothetical protein
MHPLPARDFDFGQICKLEIVPIDARESNEVAAP